MAIASVTSQGSIHMDVIAKIASQQCVVSSRESILPVQASTDFKTFLGSKASGAVAHDADMLLKESAYIEGTSGSPGTFFFAKNEQVKETGAFEAVVVNRLGEKTLTSLRQFAGGWMLGSSATVYKSLTALCKELTAGMEDILGGVDGIPFMNAEQAEKAVAKLSTEAPGTYLLFSHTPLINAEEGQQKRNVIFWVGKDGDLNHAHFHYDQSKKLWINAGPYWSLEDTPKDPTLAGLIEKKISLSLGVSGKARQITLEG